MPKLLDYIKEKGLTHDQVIEILEKQKDKPETQTEVDIQTSDDSEQSDLPDSNQIEVETEIENEEPEVEQISMDELDKRIDERVQKILKIKRKVPSKGTIINKKDAPEEPDVIKKNWFEVLV